MWRDLLRKALVSASVIPRPDLVARIMDRHPNPEDMPTGMLVVVKDGERQKWACFRCPCGCGAKLQLSLNQTRRPRWSVGLDWLRRPSISPSVYQLNACQSHFWVKGGIIEWCANGDR